MPLASSLEEALVIELLKPHRKIRILKGLEEPDMNPLSTTALL
jgi:hypothetical protein